MALSRRNPPRPKPALVGRQTGDAQQDPAILALQEAVRRLERREEPNPFVLTILPIPAAAAAVQIDAAGELASNEQANPIVDLWVTNLHTSGTESHGPRFVQMPAALGGIASGAPIHFTNGRGIGSAGGACSFYTDVPPVERGKRIRSISARLDLGVTAGTTQIDVKHRQAVPVTIGTASTTSTAGGIHDLTVTFAGPTFLPVVAGDSWVIFVQLPRSQDSLETITVEYDAA